MEEKERRGDFIFLYQHLKLKNYTMPEYTTCNSICPKCKNCVVYAVARWFFNTIYSLDCSHNCKVIVFVNSFPFIVGSQLTVKLVDFSVDRQIQIRYLIQKPSKMEEKRQKKNRQY